MSVSMKFTAGNSLIY